jgi:hypothetical protein
MPGRYPQREWIATLSRWLSQPAHAGAAGGGTLEREQQPDRGRLARPVGAEEPEHLPRLDAQIETIDRDRRTKRRRQPERLNGGGHR